MTGPAEGNETLIHHDHPRDSFTIIANRVLRDSRLTTDALAILARLMSHVDGWRFNATTQAKEWPDLSQRAAERAITLLRECGYVHKVIQSGGRNAVTTTYHLFATPPAGPCGIKGCQDCAVIDPAKLTGRNEQGVTGETPGRFDPAAIDSRYVSGHIEDHQLPEDHESKDGDPLRGSLSSQPASQVGDGGDEANEYASYTRFMAAYPVSRRHPDPKRIREAFTKALRLASGAEIVTAAGKYAEAMRDRDPNKVKSPVSWLTERRWEDDPFQAGIDEPGFRPDADALCEKLADRIEANFGKRPNIPNEWRGAARRMLDIDHRTMAQVNAAIDWCQDSEFWQGNILSMPKLREKYLTLRDQAIREAKRNGGPKPSPHVARAREGIDLANMFAARDQAALEASGGHPQIRSGANGTR